MVIIVGASTLVYSDELAIAQDAIIEISKGVLALFIKFDQAAYAAYLSGHGSPGQCHPWPPLHLHQAACIYKQAHCPHSLLQLP